VKLLKCRLQYTIKIKVDLNIDDLQRHYASRKKQNFKLDYSSNKALNWQWQWQWQWQ
jgi:hypothetical protein